MKRGGIAIATILFLLLALPTVGAETGPFDFYWIIFQPHTPWPTFPDLWLFAPEGEAEVVIRNHHAYSPSTASPNRGAYTYPSQAAYETTVVVPSCTFVRFPFSHLSPHQLDWGFYYVEIRSDRPLWVVGEKRKPDGSIVPDPGTARPHRGLQRSLSWGANWSLLGDDRLVVVAPETATLSMSAWGGPYAGWVANRDRTVVVKGPIVFDPYYVFDLGGSWTFRVDADVPVAMAMMEAGGFWRWDIQGVNGYHPDWVAMGSETTATTYILDRDVTFAAARMDGGGTLRVFAPDGTELFRDDLPETKGKAWGMSQGTTVDSPVFPTGPQKVVGTAPFALDAVAPTPEEGTTDSATFFGFDPASSRLLVWNEEATPVTIEVFDARNPAATATYVVGARSASSRKVSTLGLGFADSSPFLLAVRADRAVFMSVQIAGMGGYLRPYPFRFLETCPDGRSAPIACIEIKVPPAGRKVTGTCLSVMADVCHDTGSPVAARAAIASLRFDYRIGDSTVWTEIPTVDSLFPNPDSDHPWLVHWDVTDLPETTVRLRAVATDTGGGIRRSDEVPIEVSHSAWEVRADCRGAGASAEARVLSGTALEALATAADGESVVRIEAAAGVLPAGDVLHADVVDPSDARLAPMPADLRGVGEFREVRLASGTRALGGFVDLYLSYADADGDGVVDGTAFRAEDLVGVYLSDTGVWFPVETVGVDTSAREVRLRTDHFTLFGLAAPAHGPFAEGMCLLERASAPPAVLGALRAWRDLALHSRLGRLLTALYYAL